MAQYEAIGGPPDRSASIEGKVGTKSTQGAWVAISSLHDIQAARKGLGLV